MPGIRASDVPRIRIALTVYKISSIITGTFLLALVVMMVLRYGFHVDIAWSAADGVELLPQALIKELGATNVSLIILTAHGWFYVLYLGTDFVLWRLTRYSFGRFLFIALGGIIPLLSFFLESRVPRLVRARIAAATTEPVGAAA
jgi:integral membrane protein